MIHLQPQRNRHPRPQPMQAPSRPERRPHADRHRDRIVTEQLHPPAHFLPSQAPQDPVAIRSQGIEELERRADGEHGGNEVDDGLVVREEAGDVVPQAGEEDEVEEPDAHGGYEGDFCGCLGGVGECGADEVCDARGGGDGDGEGDLEGYARGGDEDALRGEEGGAEVRGREGEDLEREHFRLHHHEPREREADHRTPVLEGALGEAGPAGGAGDEANVEGEEDGEEGICDCDGDGGADKAPVELPDEEVVHEGVEGGADKEDVERGGEEALSLGVALSAFEAGVAGSADEDDAEVLGGEAGGGAFGDDADEDRLCAEPDDADGDGADEEEVDHALHLEADEFFAARAVGLRAEGVEAGAEALVNGVAGYVGGHAG